MNQWDSYWKTTENSPIEVLLQKYKQRFGYRKLLNVVPVSGKVLEVGAGKAWLSRLLNGTALDFSFDIARDNSHKVKNYIVGDVFELPFKDNSFDWVISCGLLEHFSINTAIEIVKEMKQVGSNVVAWYPACDRAWRLFWKLRNRFSFVPDIVFPHNPNDLGLNIITKGTVKFIGVFKYIYVWGN